MAGNIQFAKGEFDDPPAKFRSAVWKHFKFPVYYENGVRKVSREKTVCQTCKASIAYNGNTTNMSTHVSRHHPSYLVDDEDGSKKRKSGTSEAHIGKKQKKSGGMTQLKLSEAYGQKLASNSDRCKLITKSIGRFIAHDLRPYSVVDSIGFIELLRVLEPRYDMPSRTHISSKVIPELYNEVRDAVKDELKMASAIAITTDGWTSRATESYITITAHYISDDWEIRNKVLQTRPIYDSHTGINIAEVLKSAITEWDLDRPGGMACVSDNASNMDIAVREAGIARHVKCFAHTVNLASQRGLQVDGVHTLLAKIRKIVGFFHRSSTANALLKSKQELLQLPKHKLIQDVCTRWNSSYEMLERYLEQQAAVLSVLMSKEIRKTEKDLNLTDRDLTNAEDLVTVLKPLRTITTVLCDEQNPTISLIYPLKQQILSLMQVQGTDSTMIKNVRNAICNDIQKRYSDNEEFLLMTSALDPRFRSLPWLDDDKRFSVYTSLIQQTTEASHEVYVKQEPEDPQLGSPALPDLPQNLPQNLPQTSEESDKEGQTKSKSKQAVSTKPKPSVPHQSSSAMEDLFGDVLITHVHSAKPVCVRTEEEVNLYKTEDCVQVTSNPLLWWKENHQRFPLLAKMARKYLCIPGTSVPSERVFSTAGDIVTAQRAQLKADSVDKLIFLKKNMKFQT